MTTQALGEIEQVIRDAVVSFLDDRAEGSSLELLGGLFKLTWLDADHVQLTRPGETVEVYDLQG